MTATQDGSSQREEGGVGYVAVGSCADCVARVRNIDGHNDADLWTVDILSDVNRPDDGPGRWGLLFAPP